MPKPSMGEGTAEVEAPTFMPGRTSTALFHHLTLELLCESFYALARQAAPGVNGVTWEAYKAPLAENLRELHARLHQGR